MSNLQFIALHVPNVWQTCEWYRQVFGFAAVFSSDASAARLDVPGQRMVFAAHAAQEDAFGPHRLNSFLHDAPAMHLDIITADVQVLFDHALVRWWVKLDRIGWYLPFVMKDAPNPDKRRKYDTAFRAEALRLAGESRSTQVAARALNIDPKRIYQWQKAAQTPPAAALGACLDAATAAELRQ